MLVFDIETDGLLDTLTTIHCMAIYDTDTKEFHLFSPNEIEQGVQMLLQGDSICGHNVIAFDVPAIEKLYDVHFDHEKVVDTLVLARLVYSNIKDIDMGFMRKGILPRKLYGSHSLKAYGYRLGELKGTYSEDNEDAWAIFNEEMLEYNKQDVVVTHKLYLKLVDKGFTEHSSKIEHKAQWLMQKQETNGFPFDISKAKLLESDIRHELGIVLKELEKYVPAIPDRIFIPKRDNKTLGYKAGVPVQKYKEFKINSRQQLQYILREHFRYTFPMDSMYEIELDNEGEEISRKLKLDEETLKLIIHDTDASPEVIRIAELYSRAFMLSKRLGQIADGQNAWLKLVGDDDKIHGKVNPNGAVSGRATHSRPNVSQVPSIDSPYGHQCRELFHVPEGWYQAGIDCSGLELRCLAHFLYPYDDGAYAHEILNGDIHTANQKNAGLETRSQAKTFIYGFLRHH